MIRSLCIFAVISGLGIFSNAQPAPNSVSAAEKAEAVKGSNAFALDLYGQLRSQTGNLFFSPESISTAFAMTYAGARGETASQMKAVFHFTLPDDRLHAAMGALLAGMNAQHTGYQLRVANALWGQRDENFLRSYLDLVKTGYGAGLRLVDFRSSPEEVRTTINRWIEKQTNDKIKDMLPSGSITPATRLVLTNAIYFKGTWMYQFEKSATRLDAFHPSAAQSVQTLFMHRTGEYEYCDGGTFQALELRYFNSDLAMVILLPKVTGGLPALEQSMTAGSLDQWFGQLHNEDKVILSLPRFTFTQQFELSKALAEMGMPQAFLDSANFTGMTGKPGLHISAAIHKAFIDVNETGTEAAAATSTIMTAAMARPAEQPVVFNADHPFVFLIRDTRSGSILFLGRVVDPTK
ncbi:MAG TPA: serpin family protein [Terracidiphilus sp.]|nr:serpin family protein [Terracidiphilus sp.]